MKTLQEITQMFKVGQKVIYVQHNVFDGRDENGGYRHKDSEPEIKTVLAVSDKGKVKFKDTRGKTRIFDIAAFNYLVVSDRQVTFFNYCALGEGRFSFFF